MKKNSKVRRYKLTKSGKKIPMEVYLKWKAKKEAEPNPEYNDEIILKTDLAWLREENK